ncbi:MAG TPA: DUF4129 domain-containing protein [Vicinamibacteria bacterium]
MSRSRLLTLALAILVSSRAYAQEQTEEAGSEQQAEGVQETEAEPVGYEYEDESVIQMALEETLSQPEFERLRKEPEPKEETRESSFPEWLDKLFERIARAIWGDDARKKDSSGLALNLPGAGLLIYAMAAIILIAAVFFIAKSVLAISRDKKISRQEAETQVFGPESVPGELDPEEYYRRALSHGERKHYKEGMRELLLGAMSAAERRGLIRFRRGLTNRDYWYSVRGPTRESFSSIASAFEYVYFGRREATADAFRDSCRAFLKSFREASS